jgi:hypothetical protein
MPPNTLPIYPLTVQSAAVSFVNADGTAEKTLVTAGSNGSRIDSVAIASDDTSARVFNVYINNGSTSYRVGTVNVPITAGTDAAATPPVSLLTTGNLPWLDSSGSIFLKAGWKLNVAAQVAVTAAKTISFVASYGDY